MSTVSCTTVDVNPGRPPVTPTCELRTRSRTCRNLQKRIETVCGLPVSPRPKGASSRTSKRACQGEETLSRLEVQVCSDFPNSRQNLDERGPLMPVNIEVVRETVMDELVDTRFHIDHVETFVVDVTT